VAACCRLLLSAHLPACALRSYSCPPPCPMICPCPAPPRPECRTEEEDVEVAPDARDLLTKIGVETSLR
jgi:hypothetical protein